MATLVDQPVMALNDQEPQLVEKPSVPGLVKNDEDEPIMSERTNGSVLVKNDEDPVIPEKANGYVNDNGTADTTSARKKKAPMVFIWRMTIAWILIYMGGIYAALYVVWDAKFFTILWSTALYFMAGLGTTAGVHRLWSHRAYKARLPLRIFLMLAMCTAHQNSIKTWARDHRVHHKYVDTDADPHNSRRGFLYSHIGWICLKKHPEVKEKFKLVDLSDVMNDPVAAFQHRYYWPLVITFNIIIPVMVPVLYWGETFYVSFFMSVLRYLCVLNGAFFINSAAHMWGTKPYDATINPTENEGVSILAWGEGFHNYHHTFPYDYAASELGGRLNLATMFINLMAKIGLAYDLRSPPKELVLRRKQRTGDGSRG